MVKLLKSLNPDGGTIPVVIDIPNGSVDVTDIRLFRAEVEGNPTALNAVITFDSAEAVFRRDVEYDFDIHVYVLTEGHVATMMDEMPKATVAHFDRPWDLATSSSGTGAIHAVLVKTSLQDRG